MTPDDRLTEVFDRALRNGIDHLSPIDREHYRIQDFILELEMNSLSGYFYNRVSDLDAIHATVQAMHRHGLADLAGLLNEALHLFRNYVDPGEPFTWSQIMAQHDRSNRLRSIAEQIMVLKNYGLGDSNIS